MLKENLEQVLDLIKNGNNLGEKITLVGATKTVDADIINQAVCYGLEVVAENRVQEFNLKHDKIQGARQHFIGHLQTNKVKYLVGKVDLIHSVDSVHLAKAISDMAIKRGVTQDVLIEVNVGGELSKSGVTPENAMDTLKEISALPNLSVKGLMAMLPKSEDEEYLSTLCLKMRALYEQMKKEGYPFTYLSMGMSGDYKIAIKNGSNMVRIGSGIFGARNYN